MPLNIVFGKEIYNQKRPSVAATEPLHKIIKNLEFGSAAQLIELIEQSAHTAMPMEGEMMRDGWFARYSERGSLGARSESATFLPEGGRKFDAENFVNGPLQDIEQYYNDHKAPTIIRVTPLTPDLDRIMAERGFTLERTSLSVIAPMDKAEKDPNISIFGNLVPEWFDNFLKFGGYQDRRAIHQHILPHISVPHAHFLLKDAEGHPASCGSAALYEKSLELYNGATNPEMRKQGYAARMSASRLAWGKARGAVFAHAQVWAQNPDSFRSLRRVGFVECYSYQQWKKPFNPDAAPH